MFAFITGASSGIGEACAWAFARAGWDLVLAARREDRLRELSRKLREQHRVEIQTAGLDVRRREEIEKWTSEHPQLVKAISVLVNNAGLAKGRDTLPNGNPDHWDTMIDTNIKGLLYVTRALMSGLIANRGHIVNLGSVAGRWTYPGGNVYSATKFAVRALSESMRLDLHGMGVRVTEIAPGMVETEFSEVRFEGDRERAQQVYEGMQPLRAEDIADAILWSVQRPKHVDVQEMVIFPTDQAGVGLVHRTK